MAVHVGADDIHFLGMCRADLGAVNLLARADVARLGVARAQREIGLAERIRVYAERPAQAAVASAALRRVGAPRDRRPAGPPGIGRKIVILDAGGVRVAVALELRLDPVDRRAVAVRALPAVAELREALDRRLVPLQIEPAHQHLDRVGGRGGRGGRTRRRWLGTNG